MSKLKTVLVIGLTVISLQLLSLMLLKTVRDVEPKLVADSRELRQLLPPPVYRVFSFGFLPAVVDWQWLKVLQDPEIFHVKSGERASSYFVFNLLTELDPLFRQGYLAGAKLLAIIRDDVEGARLLMVKAHERLHGELAKMPDAWLERYWYPRWEVPFFLGYLYLFELGDLNQAEPYLLEAAAMDGAPNYLKQTASRFQRPGGRFEYGLRLVSILLEQRKQALEKEGTPRGEWARDREFQELTKKRSSIFVFDFLEKINADFQAYLNQKGPYRNRPDVSRLQLETFFKKFLAQKKISIRDPFGGLIRLSSDGRITTSTATVPVLGFK